MMNLRWDAYFERVKSLELQFGTLKRCIADLQRPSQRSTVFSSFLNDWSESLKRSSKQWLSSAEWKTDHAWTSRAAAFSRYLQDHLPRIPQQAELLNRLAQNELILRIAVFEAFMKDIHRAVLQADPKLLPQDREVPLGRLVTLGFEALLKEEIERAVHDLDRKNIEQRAKHFNEALRLKCYPQGSVKVVQKLNDMRNRILHEDVDLQIEDKQIQPDYAVLLEIVWWAVTLGSERYPGTFEKPGPLEPATGV